MPERQTIAFAGGGHAHLYSLRRAGELVRRGYDVVLVNPSRFLYYSGMATGVISRTHAPEDDRIDLRRLVERGGGRFVEGRVERVLPPERTLVLEGGERLTYDAASFCVGSGVAEPVAQEEADVLPVKPVENTARILERLSGFGTGVRVLVVGGGAAGCEVAANAASLMQDLGLRGRVTVAEAGPTLLASSPVRARRLLYEHLRSRGVEVLLGCAVRSYDGGVATAEDGRTLEADLIVPATGVVPPGVFRRSRLPTGDDGGLWVDHYLRSPADARLFGGGDAVSFRGRGLPKLGVFAIRQGPVLYRNLQAVLRSEPLQEFRPQRRYLYVLELGDGTGLAIYGPLSYRGRLAAALKHRIDRNFMALYR
jgi:NADH dehydrogenase FAD-containing subunit